MQLSKRLQAVANMVSAGSRLADVGCDHAFLPLFLIREKRIPLAIAMDVKKGPLSRAAEHIRDACLEDKIETRLSDGLKALTPFEADTLVIAGMGGILIQKILSESSDVRDSFKEIILQPQSDIPGVRRYMPEAGFDLVDEDMVKEDGKYYFIMKWVPGKTKTNGHSNSDRVLFDESWRFSAPPAWSLEELWFGPVLLQKRHPVLSDYLENEKRIRLEILSALCSQESERSLKRKNEIQDELALIDRALQRMHYL